MSLGTSISKLRIAANLSQEKLAQILNVTRQAVQKWETDTAHPDLDNIIKIAKFFSVSVDMLVLGSDKRSMEEFAYNKKIQPDYANFDAYDSYSDSLATEYAQSVDEGKNIAEYEEVFKAVAKMPKGDRREKIAEILFDIVLNSAQVSGYPYNEPSELEPIRSLRPRFEYKAHGTLSERALKDKIHGAWTGRICGCLLGKPIECIRTNELHPILKATGNYPMHRYMTSADITEEMCEKYTFRFKERHPFWADIVTCAPVDDDTNYVVLANVLVEKYGRNFTPYDVSKVWLEYLPKSAYCTAERVAFCNFVNGFAPPDSAIHKNPYREWIGAQIRGDYFGYINPGNPELAAEMAWRDASVSHIKNGIYGEMFVAAMIAAAAVNENIEEIILGGLAQIPETSRFYAAVSGIVSDYKKGVSEEKCFGKIHNAYDEHDAHGWCHTLSNAMIVTAALLYGGGDYGKSICKSVQTGFDTDCNGATVGSVLGMRNGIGGVGAEWTKPVNGMLDTSVFGVGKVKILDMVEATMKHLPE